ncbi:zinc-binding dehydrogenase [Solirubrobacter soli]|uniref:zinc-binding dehydrogenase n=1 Tax=Solirubrobacter soli TaxID=363832 RepID=UPI00041EF8EE|nr:Zn-dependent alcohol dehydrogenase [Solirubrobacter soli]
MRAAVLHETGAPLALEELELEPPRAGELLVRVEAGGVCHSDHHYMTGDLRVPLPVVVGHEGCGVVEAVGPGVESVQPGERVALLWRPRCGRCLHCLAGQPVMCVLGRVQAATGGLPDDGTTRLRLGGREVHHLMGVSCFAERAVVSEKSVVKVPDAIPSSIAAITGCAVITGVGAVLNVVGQCAGRPLLIVGAGGVGLSAVMGARLAGAEPIIVADLDEAKLERARVLGATAVVHAGREDLVEAVLEAVPGGVDWAIEAVGRAQTLQQAVACVGPGGTVVALGIGRVGATFEVPINELVQQQKRIVGSLYGSANPPLDLPRLWALYTAGRLPLDTLLGAEYPLAAVNEAYDALVSGAVGRAVLRP